MDMLIAVVLVAALVGGSIWFWKLGAISEKALGITLSLALVAASVLYWISERVA